MFRHIILVNKEFKKFKLFTVLQIKQYNKEKLNRSCEGTPINQYMIINVIINQLINVQQILREIHQI